MDQKIADELIRAGLELRHDEDGLVLEGDGMALRASFDEMKHRLLPGKLNRELLVRACKVKGVAAPRLVDATAGPVSYTHLTRSTRRNAANGTSSPSYARWA